MEYPPACRLAFPAFKNSEVSGWDTAHNRGVDGEAPFPILIGIRKPCFSLPKRPLTAEQVAFSTAHYKAVLSRLQE
jgi:hypothetical protein